MVGTWSGSFTNANFAGTNYQALNGVRCFIDMSTSPGPVEVLAPPSPEENESFIIVWDNPAREMLTFTSTKDFVDPGTIIHTVVPELTTTLRRGLVSFTYIDGEWQLSNWSHFGISLTTTFGVSWEGRSTNGLCTITGSYNVVEVERTALGFYTLRLEAGVLELPVLISPAPIATSLPIETSAEIRLEDVGMASVNEIIINSGIRNKNGQFSDNDLLQDPANFMALVGQEFP